MLAQIDQHLDELTERDDESYGCFTRALVHTVFQNESGESARKQGALWIATLTDPVLRIKWITWFNARMVKHKETDSGAI